MPTAAYNLRRFVELIESWGLTDVMLPFMLIFTILFAILQKTEILGTKRKNLNVVLALVIALMVVIPHVTDMYPENADPVTIMNKALPTVSLVIVAVIMMLILIGIFGGEARFLGMALPGWIAGISFALIIIIFGSAAGWWKGWSWFTTFFGSDAVAIIIIILVFGIIIAFITSSAEEATERTRLGRLGEDMKAIFGGKRE